MRPQFFCLLLNLSLSVSFLIVDGVSAAGAVGGRSHGLLGGWTPIKDLKDPQVIEIGEFAITEHNKEAKTDLKFQRVVKGETQVVSGTNYRLTIEAKDGAVSNNYEAVVWDKPWVHYRNLTSFKRV